MAEISFVIPIYNTPIEDLRKCVLSVLNIDFLQYEIILIDDGSNPTLGTAYDDFVASLHTTSVRCVHQDNKGVSAARNLGISLAIGRYIMFVDSDDSIIADALKETFCGDIVFYDYVLSKGKNRRTILTAVENQNGVITQQDLAWSVLQGKLRACRYLYKRAFILNNKISFTEGVIQGEDAEFNFQCMVKLPLIQYIRKPLYCYHYSSETALNRWKKQPEKMIINDAKRFALFLELLPKLFPDDYAEKKVKLITSRIREIHNCGISLCCAKRAEARYQRLIEDLMNELVLPDGADKATRRCYYDVIEKKWGKLHAVGLLRRIYWSVMGV